MVVVALAVLAVTSASARATSPGAFETRIAAAGDIACDPDDAPDPAGCAQADTAALVTASGASRVLALGDLQYSAGSLNDFQTGYDLTWGDFRSMTLPVPGNHEYGTANAAGYYAYWGAQAGDPTKGYYAERIGSWLIVALNSNCAQIGGCERSSAQGQWLQAQLSASDAPCTLAMWHHPRFSSGLHGDASAVAPLWEILQEHDAELVLSGHDHGYERFAPMRADGTLADDGLDSIVIGTGGINLRDFAGIRSGSVRQEKAFGVSVIDLHANGWSEEFRTTDGRVIAGSSGTCAAEAAATPPPTEGSAPAALGRQSAPRVGGLALGATRRIASTTTAGQPVRWRNRTRTVCALTRQVVGGAVVWRLHAIRAGTCRLRATSPGSATLEPLDAVVAVAVSARPRAGGASKNQT